MSPITNPRCSSCLAVVLARPCRSVALKTSTVIVDGLGSGFGEAGASPCPTRPGEPDPDGCGVGQPDVVGDDAAGVRLAVRERPADGCSGDERDEADEKGGEGAAPPSPASTARRQGAHRRTIYVVVPPSRACDAPSEASPGPPRGGRPRRARGRGRPAAAAAQHVRRGAGRPRGRARRTTAPRGRTGRRRSSRPRRAGSPGRGPAWWSPARPGAPDGAAPWTSRGRSARGPGRGGRHPPVGRSRAESRRPA